MFERRAYIENGSVNRIYKSRAVRISLGRNIMQR
jgi:hypothetical protein